MTITSFTDPRKTYETTDTDCTCGDFIYRGSRTGKPCKHMVAIEAARAVTFLELKRRFDIRNQPLRQFTYVEDGQVHTARRVDWDFILDDTEKRATAPLSSNRGFSLLR